MERPRLQARQSKLAQPLAHRALVHRHVEAPLDLAAEIDAPPAHYIMFLGIGTGHNDLAQLGHLRLA